ncbi:MAG TPA: hypothetical protein VFO09_06815 [Methyloceanibacter sp.]|nr:hypothetical protein [Methyloceanibacter sp.]
MRWVAVYLYITAVGFVAAGLLASFVQLISGEPMRFRIEPDSVLASIGGVLLRVLAGPAILMRNAWRGMVIERRPMGWFGASLATAALWSLFSGAVLLDLIMTLNL